jgi:hypothetical protein
MVEPILFPACECRIEKKPTNYYPLTSIRPLEALKGTISSDYICLKMV